MDVPYVVYLNQPNRLVYPRNVDRQTGWVSNADYRLLAAIVLRATRFVAWADRRSIQEADQLLVNGNYIGDIIRTTYRRDAIDCPAGCHVAARGFPLPLESRFAGGFTINGYPIRRPYVLLTNRHYPQKRFDLAIRAMLDVRKRHPRVQLVVPGPRTRRPVRGGWSGRGASTGKGTSASSSAGCWTSRALTNRSPWEPRPRESAAGGVGRARRSVGHGRGRLGGTDHRRIHRPGEGI